jgi:hypothetical protein
MVIYKTRAGTRKRTGFLLTLGQLSRSWSPSATLRLYATLYIKVTPSVDYRKLL